MRYGGDEGMKPAIIKKMITWLSAILIVLSLTFTGVGSETSTQSAMGMVTVDGHAVPDIGPLPTVIPQPPGNLNYAEKVSLGKQLYFDGRL